MAENITSISDPSVYFKASEKLRNFFKKYKEEIYRYKEPVPNNILKLDSSTDMLLKVGDIEWLNSFLNHKRTESADFQPLKGDALDKEIFNLLDKNEFAQYVNVKSDKESDMYLHELLDTSKFLLPKNEVIQRNPVLAARIEKLKKEQEEREYKAMTRNVETSRVFMKEDTVAFQMNMMNRHLIAVGQFAISVATGFAFGFLGIELLVGELDFGVRLLLGIACALTVALAEFYFLAKHLSEEESAADEMNQGTYCQNNLKTNKVHKD